MLDRTLDHLRELVAADSTNPPRAITRDHRAVTHAASVLAACGFDVTIDDLGGGSVNVLAVRGEPDVLVNCHLDTVPADAGWERDPFTLHVENGRAVGLGACDIKGAAACLLAASQATEGAAAILFTTDEEAGRAACVRAFLDADRNDYSGVVVAEPTGCRGVTAHRGLLSCRVEFTGRGGHASTATDTHQSAVHSLVRWAAGAAENPSLRPHRFNVGVVEGGVKPNMIASSAAARFGLRPAPGADVSAIMQVVKSHSPAHVSAEWSTTFKGSALASGAGSDTLVARLGVAPGETVDFWTEAALFTEAGMPAVVFGPGDIAQAHTAGEFVELGQLERAAAVYAELLSPVKEGARA